MKKNLRIGIVGAGCMGRGVTLQVQATPGMSVAWVADQQAEAARSASELAPGARSGPDALAFLKNDPVDVLVECTNSIGAAAEYCLAAFAAKSHVVLMNAEVDLALGPLLSAEAERHGVSVTSDAGDQHGVLASLIAEAELMGFEIVQAGNIKGFLDRRATPESIRHEAAKRRLSATQCCAYTDGTKLHIEMAVLANALGYLPPEGGMTGPRAATVQEALTAFDFSGYGDTPRIDYLLGAEPGGGVYLVVRPRPDLPAEQAFYLNYYKLGSGPEYLLYRPYHLCHLETPKAILAAAEGRPLLTTRRQSCAVYAYAKRPLRAGQPLRHAIGSAECYGLVEPLNPRRVPITLLENESILRKDVAEDEALTWDHLDLPDCPLTTLWKKQQELLALPQP
ncbi:homoserine dehydrogenase [Roseibacillus ishigakijimensis]|uniref:Homoserine dehydrogenase n=1 Tax=Roseibacillus ishigakijimensis TaxID=454146 RepID=A0A934RSK8_9BACT|nr:homoserine dehydrogenase [Roseibacillus ishigakijimensis]MBK1833460.1 homoserine dehydrogenase [Roseibacillus ishigakijimensis]